MTFPLDRVPARARPAPLSPAASRPPSPASPARGTPGGPPSRGPREAGGAEGGAHGSGARRGRVRAGGGVGGEKMPARVRGRGRWGVCVCVRVPGSQGARRASDPGPPESGGRTAGRTHARAQAGPRSAPTRREAARPDRLSSAPVISATFLQSLRTPHACLRCHTNKKRKQKPERKISFDLSFSDFSENPAPDTLSPVSFIQVVALLVVPSEDMPPPPLIDLEVGTSRFGGMISHQQPGHGLGSAAEAAVFVLWSSLLSQEESGVRLSSVS